MAEPKIDHALIKRGWAKLKKRKKTAEDLLGIKRYRHAVNTMGVDGFCDWQENLDKQKEAINQKDLKNSLDSIGKEALAEFNSKFAMGARISERRWNSIFKKENQHASQ